MEATRLLKKQFQKIPFPNILRELWHILFCFNIAVVGPSLDCQHVDHKESTGFF